MVLNMGQYYCSEERIGIPVVVPVVGFSRVCVEKRRACKILVFFIVRGWTSANAGPTKP